MQRRAGMRAGNEAASCNSDDLWKKVALGGGASGDPEANPLSGRNASKTTHL